MLSSLQALSVTRLQELCQHIKRMSNGKIKRFVKRKAIDLSLNLNSNENVVNALQVPQEITNMLTRLSVDNDNDDICTIIILFRCLQICFGPSTLRMIDVY